MGDDRLVPVVLALAVLALALAVLTGLGDRRRGHALPHALAAALLFPATWAAWYVVDEHPYRGARATGR